jgi:small subunit ribosomal protein S16
MAVKIRLRKQGRTNYPVYRLVVTESRNKRDGKYMELLGSYNPQDRDEDRGLIVKADRVQHWLDHGAEISDKAESLVKRAAPAVIKSYRERLVARKAKASAKRRARRKAAAA